MYTLDSNFLGPRVNTNICDFMGLSKMKLEYQIFKQQGLHVSYIDRQA